MRWIGGRVGSDPKVFFHLEFSVMFYEVHLQYLTSVAFCKAAILGREVLLSQKQYMAQLLILLERLALN